MAFSTNTVPSEIEICSGSASIPGAAAAIALPPHLDVDVPFPPNQRLGADDIAWFRVMPRPTLMAKPRNEEIRLSSPDGRSGSLELVDRSQVTVLKPRITGSGTLSQTFTAAATDDFLAKVTRDGDDATGHVVRWHTPVTYCRLDDVFTIHVNDETSGDWPGADEPELVLSIDGELFLSTSWDDADTGEDWPGLADLMRSTAVKRGWLSASLAFSQSIDFELEDPDPPLGAAHGVKTHTINTLAPNDNQPPHRSKAVTVFDTVSDGTYSLAYSLSRDP